MMILQYHFIAFGVWHAGGEELPAEKVKALVREEITAVTANRTSREHIRLFEVCDASLKRSIAGMQITS